MGEREGIAGGKYPSIKPLIEEVIDEYPEYGRPRITEELQDEYGLEINHKVVGKLLQGWDLAIRRAARTTSPSPVEKAIKQAGDDANLVKKRLDNNIPIGLFDVLYTEFTDRDCAAGKTTFKLMPIIDHTSKLIIGWALGRRRNKGVACQAGDNTKHTLGEIEVDWSDTIVHQDQDSVYTSNRWVDQLIEDRIRLSYSTNGAQANPYRESFNGHFKGPIESLLVQAETRSDVKGVIRKRVNEWNHDRRHSSLGQMAPIPYIETRRKEN